MTDSEKCYENICVAVRVRPLNKKEEKEGREPALQIKPNENSIYISQLGDSDKIQQFIFDHVFDYSTGQGEIFDRVAKNAIDWVCQGYNSTIFAYGCTSSGKSYTMFGHENGQKQYNGIIPRSCDALFANVNQNEDVVEATMKCSFLEIYREHIRDLLNPEPIELKIRQNPIKGVYVQGLLEKHVCSPAEILNTIKEGSLQRTVGSTALNSVSSRSHAMLTLTVSQKFTDGSETNSRLHLIDLAGSENVGRSEAQGVTLAEAQTINKSLSCLGNVIYALTEKGREHIPYRDSKLTYLLQDSLGGNAKTIIIATASPALSCYSETLNTLKFAKRAKEIKNAPKINRNESVVNLLKTIDELKETIAKLEKKCTESAVIIEAVEQVQNNKEIILYQTKVERLEKRIEQLENNLVEERKHTEHIKIFYEKQRALAQKVSRHLYRERIRNCALLNELEQYQLFYNNIKDLVSKPSVLAMVVERSAIHRTEEQPQSEESDIDSVASY